MSLAQPPRTRCPFPSTRRAAAYFTAWCIHKNNVTTYAARSGLFDRTLPMKPTAIIHAFLGGFPGFPLAWTIALAVSLQPADAGEPRIVNIYNFVRNSDYRLVNSENILFETTRREIELIKPTGLPATWALQYDALINPRYQKLFKEQLGTNDEIAAWWEIPRPLTEKAGLKWRGHDHEWDSTANVGFSPGYTPDERRKLVDVYMADFKAIFGYYPRTAGSWFIDEVTLEYMARRYRIIASCNCKDQVGTDGYTLWGGYWNQAHFPSRLNAYMPAQTKAGQIDVPIFRMLGSDPIYQYGNSPGMFTLEPVYPNAGGSADWVTWFMTPGSSLAVKELNRTDLSITQKLNGGGTFTIVCRKSIITCTCVDNRGQPLRWAWDMVGGARQTTAVQKVTPNSITYVFSPVSVNGTAGTGVSYQLRLSAGAGSCRQLSNGDLRLSPNSSGVLEMILDPAM